MGVPIHAAVLSTAATVLLFAHPAAATGGMWVDFDRLAELPTAGAAWDHLRSAADSDLGTADLSARGNDHDVGTLAQALVARRLGLAGGGAVYRATAAANILSAIGTEGQSNALPIGRNLTSYVIAADLIDLAAHDATAEQSFRAWLADIRYRDFAGGTIVGKSEERPNNWGLMVLGARLAVAIYLNDHGGVPPEACRGLPTACANPVAEIGRVARIFRGWLGDRAVYSAFEFGDLSWQCDPGEPVGINPVGCEKDGRVIDGVLPDDQRRAGGFVWPPPKTFYVWEALQGAVVVATLLHRQGHDAWRWSDRALLRAFEWLHRPHFDDGSDHRAVGDDRWQPHLVNYFYGTSFPAPTGVAPGKNMGWTDWTHGPAASRPVLTLDAFDPVGGQVGSAVALRGEGFSQVTAVAFAGAEASRFTVESDDTLVAIVPAGAASGPISLVGGEGIAVSRRDFLVHSDLHAGGELEVGGIRDRARVVAAGKSAARTRDGGFVVAWHLVGAGVPGGRNVFAGLYDSLGRPAREPFQVNTSTTDRQENAAVAATDDGGFVVVWESLEQDGDGDGLFARLFDSAGAARGDEIAINTYTTGFQNRPAVAAVDGGFVAAWRSQGQDGDGNAVIARVFDAAGGPVTPELALNAYTTGRQDDPVVARSGTGFVAAWSSPGLDGDSTAVVARRFDAAGLALGSELLVNEYSTGRQERPAVVSTADDGFVVAWESREQDGDGDAVVARRFRADGSAIGAEILVNVHTTGSQQRPALSTGRDGSLVVAWQGREQPFENGFGIHARLVEPSGEGAGEPFLVNSHTTGDQVDAAIAGGGDGKFLVVWRSRDDGRDREGVVGQFFAPSVCGQVASTGSATAVDVLALMRVVVGLRSCEPCVCDVDGSGEVGIADVLRLLQFTAGAPATLGCPPCGVLR